MEKEGDNNPKCDEPSGNEPKQQQDKTGTGAGRKQEASFTSTQRPTQRPLQVSGDSNHPGSPRQQRPNRQQSQQQQICTKPSMAAQSSSSSQKHSSHHQSSHQSKMQTDDIRQRREIISLKSHLERFTISTLTDKQERLVFTQFKKKFLEYLVSKKPKKPEVTELKAWMKRDKIPFYTDKEKLYCNVNVLFNFDDKGAKNDFMAGTNYKELRPILLRHNIVRELSEELSKQEYVFEIPFNQIVNIDQGTAIPNIGGPGPDAQS